MQRGLAVTVAAEARNAKAQWAVLHTIAAAPSQSADHFHATAVKQKWADVPSVMRNDGWQQIVAACTHTLDTNARKQSWQALGARDIVRLATSCSKLAKACGRRGGRGDVGAHCSGLVVCVCGCGVA
jgi:hypothetical protein